MGGPLALCCPPGPCLEPHSSHPPHTLLNAPNPLLGTSVDSDSQPFLLPAGACSQEWGGGSRLQLPPGQAAAAQGTGEAGQLPQGTRPHPYSHRSLGPLSREPTKTRPCTVILNGHLSRRERQRQCQNLPPTQTSPHYARPTRVCAHTPKHRQGSPGNTGTPTSDPHAESKTLTASPTLCTDPPWV